MPIILVGLNHRTAPVALREQLSLSGRALDAALSALNIGELMLLHANSEGAASHNLHETVILSTCNRMEVYAVSGDVATGLAAIESYLASLAGVPVETLHPHLYLLEDQAAVEHLMGVTAGLDSLILGEPQIQGQVAEAFAHSKGQGTAGLILSQLFSRATHAGKRARSETAINRHTTSVSHAAARRAREVFGALSEARILVLGAGQMAELAAAALCDEGARHITCINRTFADAQRLAQRIGGRALRWASFADALAETDVIITATGAPHVVIYRDDVAQVLPLRKGRPLVIIDVAVPRDVEAEVDNLPGVLRYDVDHLQDTVDANRTQREAAVPQVEAILRQETEEFFCWLRARQVVPVLVELRRMAEAVAQSELELMLRRLGSDDPRTEQVMGLLVHRIVNKLLHEPTMRLKAEAANGNGVVYADALRELFALDAPGEMVCPPLHGDPTLE